jgi:mannan endo-1,4-beta-mannosidase
VELSIVDKNATAETKALYARLWEVQQSGFMFGHHDDLFYGRKWYNESGGSDTKDVCGDYPGVFSVDFAEVMDDRSEGNTDNEIRKRCILEARRRGEVIMACAHLNNPQTGGDAWDNSSATVAREILQDGSAVQATFQTWLDRLAVFADGLKDDQGKPIPIILRPFHEHTQTWSWWGRSCTTETEFVNLWKFTVNYLRNIKGVHQFIYAISPQMDTTKREDDFLFRWPGDDYVDFIGMDCYQGLNPAVFSSNLKTLSDLAKTKKKPCGVTETGVEGFTDKDYWTKQILTPATGRNVSMIVMWRNKFVGGNDSDMHYFSVFKGHASEADFNKFYASPLTYFSKDLPSMYQMPDNIKVK